MERERQRERQRYIDRYLDTYVYMYVCIYVRMYVFLDIFYMYASPVLGFWRHVRQREQLSRAYNTWQGQHYTFLYLVATDVTHIVENLIITHCASLKIAWIKG